MVRAGAGRTLTAADAIELYDGAGGGTGFDLSRSGFEAVRYVKLEGRPGFSGGEVDALAAVRPAVLGDGLLLVPENLAHGPLRLRFQRADVLLEPALEIELRALDQPARITTTLPPAAAWPAPLPGTVRAAAELTVLPVLNKPVPVFAADAWLYFGTGYTGDGRDLTVLQRRGAEWSPASFEFLPDARAVILRDLPATAAWVVAQVAAPRLEWIHESEGVTVRLAATPGWRQVLERSEDCQQWVEVIAATHQDGGSLLLRDPAPPAARAFYRVRLERP